MNAELIIKASSLLSKSKSVPFLTESGTVAEVRFATALAAAECRSDPENIIKKHDFVKVLSDLNEIIAALCKVSELEGI